MEGKPLILLASISIFLFIFGIVSIPSAAYANSNVLPISTVEINDSTVNSPVLDNNDEFGFSVANIGDLNGDGVSDIAVGATIEMIIVVPIEVLSTYYF